MRLTRFLPAAFASAISAQSIVQALSSQNATLSSLTALLGTQPQLVSALGGLSNITLLAPSNSALAKFLNSTVGASAASNPDLVTALLTYHVLNGTFPASAFTSTPVFVHSLLTNSSYTNVTGGQVVEGVLNGTEVDIYSGGLAKSVVTQANINFTGGVIHVIDTVLTIPASDSATAIAAGLSSLAGALTTANLVPTVNSLKDVTIFAPSNAAFQAIGSALPNLTTDQLTSILTYHVVQGTVGYSSLLRNTTLKTVGGGNVTITVQGGSVFVNSAKVIVPDVLVANGVVHVIDNVLNPAASTATPVPTASTQSVAFSGASSGSAVPFTSGIPAASTTASAAITTSKAGGASSAGSSSAAATGGAAAAVQTGALGMGALFGGAALLLGNLNL